jgi:hypothetical protein
MKKIFFTGLLSLITTLSLFPQQESESTGKISGYMFGDYYYNILRDSTIERISNKALSGIKDLQGFQFRRIYFTYDYKISDKFSTRFRLESQTIVGTSSTLFTTIVKDAYMKWNEIFDGSNLIFGIQPPPSFDITEDYWGHRSLEKTIIDLRGIASSRDFGLALRGKIISEGTINYWIMYGNGSVLESEGDKYKRAYAHIDLKPIENIRVICYGDYRFKPDKGYPSLTNQSFKNDALTTDLLVAYREVEIYSIGVESFLQVTYNDVVKAEQNVFTVTNRNAVGVSVFGWYRLSDLLIGVGRYDFYDPNFSGNFKGDSRNYFIAGLSFILHPKVKITPNFLLETYETPVNGVSIDPSLTGRITFYYEFL